MTGGNIAQEPASPLYEKFLCGLVAEAELRGRRYQQKLMIQWLEEHLFWDKDRNIAEFHRYELSGLVNLKIE